MNSKKSVNSKNIDEFEKIDELEIIEEFDKYWRIWKNGQNSRKLPDFMFLSLNHISAISAFSDKI